MRSRRRSIVSILSSFALALACGSDGSGTTSSAALQTSEITASMSVTATTPDQARFEVRLEDENPSRTGSTGVKLDSGETLVAWMAGISMPLELDPSAGSPTYVAELNGIAAAGVVQVLFQRADGSVVTAELNLEPGFVVTSPARGDRFSFTDDLLLEWTPGSPSRVIRIWVSVLCTTLDGGSRGQSFFLQVEDDGSFVYDLGDLAVSSDPVVDRSRDCTLGLRFAREDSIGIAPPFDLSSRFSSSQSRAVEGMTIGF